MAVEDVREEMTRNNLDCEKRTSYWIWSDSETVTKSVARIRQVID
jgi:hypothetical protein